ncbi:hypothetical protein LCGC14_0165160 [marine sediment metagenome]|uniref:Uncharacterized protein n=1 Tax=marine sediment metagenome TaxID=412755 RepID=A0A0F9VAU1_9ZZZZ
MPTIDTEPKVFQVISVEQAFEAARAARLYRYENDNAPVRIEVPEYYYNTAHCNLISILSPNDKLPESIEIVSYKCYRSEHWVPASKLAKLATKLKRLANKSKKLGTASVQMTDTGEVENRVVDSHKNAYGELVEIKHSFHRVVIEGEAPTYSGWTFLATLEYLGEHTIVKVVPGQDLPEKYRKADNYCDHCRTKRRRKETFVVRNDETGETKQVGRQCVADFLGGRDPHAVGDLCSFYSTFNAVWGNLDPDMDLRDLSGYESLISLVALLTYTSASMRKDGWLSRTAAKDRGDYTSATADLAVEGLFWNGHGKPPLKSTEQDQEQAEAAAKWAAELTDDEVKNDYMHNVRVIGMVRWCRYKQIGYAASILVAHQKHLEHEIQRREREKSQAERSQTSGYFGEIKKRYELELKVVRVHCVQSDWGETTIYGLVDKDGNEFTWFCSNEPQVDRKTGKQVPRDTMHPNDIYYGLLRGNTYKLKGTVTKHNAYKDIKQTVINRCTVLETIEHVEEDDA